MTQPKFPDRNQAIARLGGLVGAFQAEGLRDVAILEAANRGAELLNAIEGIELYQKKTEEELAAIGWTKAQLRIAIHASLPKTSLPGYLQFSQERHVARMKTLPPDAGGGNKGAAFFIPVEARSVDDDDEEEEEAP